MAQHTNSESTVFSGPVRVINIDGLNDFVPEFEFTDGWDTSEYPMSRLLEMAAGRITANGQVFKIGKDILKYGTFNDWSVQIHDLLKDPAIDNDAKALKVITEHVDDMILKRMPPGTKTSRLMLLLSLQNFSAPFQFGKLPSAIRHRVYTFTNLATTVSLLKERTKLLSPFPALAHSSSAIRQEVLSNIFEQMSITFNAYTPDRLTSFLESPGFKDHVKHLCLININVIGAPTTLIAATLDDRDKAKGEAMNTVMWGPSIAPADSFERRLYEYSARVAKSLGFDKGSNDLRGESVVKMALRMSKWCRAHHPVQV